MPQSGASSAPSVSTKPAMPMVEITDTHKAPTKKAMAGVTIPPVRAGMRSAGRSSTSRRPGQKRRWARPANEMTSRGQRQPLVAVDRPAKLTLHRP